MKNNYRNLILTAGGVMGVIYSATQILAYIIDGGKPANNWLMALGAAAIAWALIFYGKKAAALKDTEGLGFTYGQAFGFSILALLLSGLIIGFCSWLLQTVIDPEYYTAMFNKELAASGAALDDNSMAVVEKMRKLTTNIFVMTIGTSIGTAILGGLVALITSAFVTRRPNL